MRRKRTNIIDLINEYLKAVHAEKACPKCGGPLMQHRYEKRAVFCSHCFNLYKLAELTIGQWYNLVKRKKPKSQGRGRSASSNRLSVGKDV